MLDLTENGALAQGPGRTAGSRATTARQPTRTSSAFPSPEGSGGMPDQGSIVHDLYEDQPIEKITAVTGSLIVVGVVVRPFPFTWKEN